MEKNQEERLANGKVVEKVWIVTSQTIRHGNEKFRYATEDSLLQIFDSEKKCQKYISEWSQSNKEEVTQVENRVAEFRVIKPKKEGISKWYRYGSWNVQ